MSTGLKSEAPTKLNESEIIALIRDETIAGGAQLSNLSESTGQWMDLKGSHFYQYVEEVKVKKQQIREQAKTEQIEQKEAAKTNKIEIRQNRKQQKILAVVAKNKEEQKKRQSEIAEQQRQMVAKAQSAALETTALQNHDRQLFGSGCVLFGIVLIVVFGAGLIAYTSWENKQQFQKAEKTYLDACKKYNSELARALDVGAAGRSRRVFMSDLLSASEKLDELVEESKQIREIHSNAKTEYERAYSLFSDICSEKGKPPPPKLQTY